MTAENIDCGGQNEGDPTEAELVFATSLNALASGLDYWLPSGGFGGEVADIPVVHRQEPAALEPAQLCLETRAQIVNLVRESHAMIFPGYPAKRTVVVEDDAAPQSVTDRPLMPLITLLERWR